jgi:uncharacterized membrane protein SpoIIM required for sporulation
MKEVTFIRQNIEKWKETEKVADEADKLNPDVIADAYTEVTDDLAFAQSHYPTSRITIYLNNLASTLHNIIYRNKKEKWTRIFTFWRDEMPHIIYDARKELILSLVIFIAAVGIGILSTSFEKDAFPRLILGDNYVDMTLENISKGKPMAIYGSDAGQSMFAEITLNNIKVSFICFVMGILTSLGTAYMLFYNGVMIGAFQTFMFLHGVGGASMLAIWLHGTLEISATIIAGGAGIALGNGMLFPGTYSRIESFKRGAKRGLKIVIGTIPLFIVAGFIESFVTRHTEYPIGVRLSIILLSLAFIVYYYIYLPIKKYHGLSAKT